MKSEKNKFSCVWISCLLFIIILCGIGIIFTNKGTRASENFEGYGCYYVENKENTSESSFVFTDSPPADAVLMWRRDSLPGYYNEDRCLKDTHLYITVRYRGGEHVDTETVAFLPGTEIMLAKFFPIPKGYVLLSDYKLVEVNDKSVTYYPTQYWFSRERRFTMGTEFKFEDINGNIVSTGLLFASVVFDVEVRKISVSKYTVTYDGNGGTPSRINDSVSAGSSISLPSATRDGYVFLGWYSGDTYVGMNDENYKPISNITLTAKWSRIYDILYNGNGKDVSNVPASSYKKHDEDYVISSILPLRDGYTFIGWNTENNGEGIYYEPGDIYTENEKLTLHAQWIKGDNLSRCNIRDNPPTSDKMLLSMGLMLLTFVGFGYFYFIIKRVKD